VAAREVWRRLAERGAAFHDNLVFQAGGLTGGRMGHWRDWLPELDKDVEKLAGMLGGAPGATRAAPARPQRDVASIEAVVPATAQAGRDLEVRLLVDAIDGQGAQWTLFYRHANQLEGAFRTVAMERCDRGFKAVIPAAYVTAEWDLLLYFGAVLEGQAVLHPGVWHASEPMPYYVVRVV
jgi:hypothetical protein